MKAILAYCVAFGAAWCIGLGFTVIDKVVWSWLMGASFILLALFWIIALIEPNRRWR